MSPDPRTPTDPDTFRDDPSMDQTMPDHMARRVCDHQPVCGAFEDGRRCRRLTVAAHHDPAIGPRDSYNAWSARCPQHAEPDAERYCVTCKRSLADSRDAYRCTSCADR